jgi:hypothetical protein
LLSSANHNAPNPIPSLRLPLRHHQYVLAFQPPRTALKTHLTPPVFLFTLALFLSGYVLQQKTLTNLRAAIRPQQPPAQLYIPSSHDAPSPLPNFTPNTPRDTRPLIEVTDSLLPPQEGSADAAHPNANTPSPKDYQSILASYFAADATRQLEHEKLSSVIAASPHPQRGAGILNKANRLIQRWIARVRGDEAALVPEEDEGVPLESLSRAARRRRIKMDIRRLESEEDVDVSKIYRPRKRAW